MNKYAVFSLSIILILVICGAVFSMSNTQEPSKIKILGNGSVVEGGTLNIKLTDLEGISLDNRMLNITIMDKNGEKIFENSTNTNYIGKATVDLDNIPVGNYTVNVTFEGDEKFSSNTTLENFEIIEKVVVEAQPVEEPAQSSVGESYSATDEYYSNANDDPYDGMYEEYPDGEGGTVHQFNWGGMTEYDFDDGYYIFEYDDGHVESGYYPGHGNN